MEPINLGISTDESILALVCSIVAAIISTYIEKRLDKNKKNKDKDNKDNKLIEKMFNRDDLLINDVLEQNKQLRLDNKELIDEINKLQEKDDIVTNCSSSVDIST